MFNFFKKKKEKKGFTSNKNLNSDNPLLDFLQEETQRIVNEADEKKKKDKSIENNKLINNFIKNLKKSLKSALGKNLKNKLNQEDKYLLGYIYGLCDYTNDLYGLDNEIGGIQTFMQLHEFFFHTKDPKVLGKLMGLTGKLSSTGNKVFLSGAIDGGKALGNEKIYKEPVKKAYIKLIEHLS